MMYLIKFGGSVITEKSKSDGIFKSKVMDQLADKLHQANKQYIIVHGAGSFGHVLAKEHDLKKGFQNDHQLMGFSLTQAKVQQLNLFMLHSLQKQGVRAVSIPPHSTVLFDNHQLHVFEEAIYRQYLNLGFIPLTYGDVVLDESQGFSICSGDDLMVVLAETFHPEKVIFVMDEDGLYWENPKKNPNAAFIDHITSNEFDKVSTKLDDHADVTGGMQGKIDTISKIVSQGNDVILLNGNKPGRLYDVLVGKETKSTVIYG